MMSMPLPATLHKRWLACPRAAVRNLEITDEGVVLGKTVLAPFKNGVLAVDRERIVAMLFVTCLGAVPANIAKCFRNAERCYKSGDKSLANMHLALLGVRAFDLEEAQRLFAAEWATDRSVTPLQLIKIANSLRKDDSEDDDEDDGDESDDEGGDSDSEGGSDFDAAHPRWPAGSPGGIGGEFAPKDSGDATNALHDAISGDAQNPAPDEGRVDESYGMDAVIGAVGALAGAELLGSDTIGAESSSASTATEAAESTATGAAETVPAAENDWSLGDFKSAQTWQNQMLQRGWTSEDISSVIQDGEQFPAPNFVNPGNSATRFVDTTTGRFVVRDDVTNEILQISRSGFVPKEFP
jgi:hypothetical protein